jgi:dTDP-4-amino-4,6-dideoxygalactose transaminase
MAVIPFADARAAPTAAHREVSTRRRGRYTGRENDLTESLMKHDIAKLPPIAFIDLETQRRRLGGRIDDAVARVLNHCQFILGPEVGLLEADLAEFCGARHAVSCSSGTTALALVLMAKGIKAGDAVLCPSFTFAATAEVVAWTGATPVFVDIDPDSFNLDPASLESGIATARNLGLRPAAVIPVDLFGQPADYDAIEPVCDAHGLWMLTDAAQSFGAVYRGRRVGTIGLATATSFYPSKPLGCYGDGGAVFTDDGDLAEAIRSIRVHGQGTDKYDNVRIGLNARLDTLQAAVLIEKLQIFAEELELRNVAASRYDAALASVAAVPRLIAGATSVWAQYTIRVPAGRRDPLAAALKGQGIPTSIHYPKPLHRQTAYCMYPVAGNGLPVSDRVAAEVVSLPMHPYLDEKDQERIADAVKAALR